MNQYYNIYTIISKAILNYSFIMKWHTLYPFAKFSILTQQIVGT